MPSSNQVLYAHCNTWMSRKREQEHRGLLFSPYVSPPPKLSSRYSRLLDSDSEEDPVQIPEVHHDAPSSESGQSVVQSDYDGPALTDSGLDDGDDEDKPRISVPDSDDDILLVQDVCWSTTLGDATRPDDKDSDSDFEEPVEDAGDDEDEGYDDWAAIEAEFGLSAWDKLGEGFEQEIADIGMFQEDLCYTFKLINSTSTGDRLSAYDHAICQAFSYKVSNHTTDNDFAKLPYAFPSEPPLPKLNRVRSRVAYLSGIKPEFYDCCPNSCCCYTGAHKNLQDCPYCKEPWFRRDGKPCKKFTYIPLIPRLIAFAGNKQLSEKMKYRAHKHEHMPGKVKDVFDGKWYQRLRTKHVELNGKTYPHKYFEDPRDLALGLSTDGFAPFKKRKSTAWPLIIFNYNLPPDICFHLENILALGVIPGPKKPMMPIPFFGHC